MEAWQHVELTSTNRPFGLIIKLTQTVDRYAIAPGKDWVSSLSKVRSTFGMSRTCMPAKFSQPNWAELFTCGFFNRTKGLSSREHEIRAFQVSGGHIARVTPVPIPNTVVKPR